MNKSTFDTRPAGSGPIYTGSYAPGDRIDTWEPEVGNIATLHSGDVSVTVRITSAKNRAYKGEIVGFENWGDYEYKGLKPGDSVDFTYEQLFGCSR